MPYLLGFPVNCSSVFVGASWGTILQTEWGGRGS